MSKLIHRSTLALPLILLASCTTEPKPAPKADQPSDSAQVTWQKGVAGGVVEDAVVVQALVSSVDVPSRKVTLTGPKGNQLTFTAGPSIKNLEQMHTGDRVTATFAQRLVISVRSDDSTPGLTHSTTRATARPGEKPGMLMAEETELVGRVTKIDATNRTADIDFGEGVVKTIPVRSDVDLSRYKVGDNVTIRVTTALTVLVQTT